MTIIVFEGIDGVGKSTLANRLAMAIDGVYYHTPPAKYQKDRARIAQEASPEEHLAFYHRALQDAAVDIENLHKSGNNIVIDRYWMSTLAYHRAMGCDVSKDTFSFCQHVDFTLYIEANQEQRSKRITVRGESEGDKRVVSIQDAILAEYDRILEHETNTARVNNSFHSIDKTFCKLLIELVKHKIIT